MRNRCMTAKGLVVCVLSVVCLMAMLLHPQAETPEMHTKETTTQTSYACIVRNKADLDGEDIGSLEDGTVITVLGQKGDFYEIDCYDMTGFVAASQVAEQDGIYRIACDPASSETEVMTYTPHTEALDLRHSLLALAREQLDKPYIYGSTGPRGFDCSGLTSYLYGTYGFDLQRRASGQLSDGIIVSREGLQVGDLVFFRFPGESALVSHVGIYVGDNQIIHASNSGITYDSLSDEYYAQRFLCVRRVVNTDCGIQETVPNGINARVSVPDSGISGRRAG